MSNFPKLDYQTQIKEDIRSLCPTFENLSNLNRRQRKRFTKLIKHFCWSEFISASKLTCNNATKFFEHHLQCFKKIYNDDAELICDVLKYNDGHPHGIQPADYGLNWKAEFAQAVIQKYPTASIDLKSKNWHDQLLVHMNVHPTEIPRRGIATVEVSQQRSLFSSDQELNKLSKQMQELKNKFFSLQLASKFESETISKTQNRPSDKVSEMFRHSTGLSMTDQSRTLLQVGSVGIYMWVSCYMADFVE